jgi:hypothetical protein
VSESNWMSLAVARAELRGAEHIANAKDAELELQLLRARVQDAMEQYKAAPDDGEECTCDWCGVEVGDESELRDVSKLERADGLEFEPDLVCLGCWDDEAAKQERLCGAYTMNLDSQEGRCP